MVDARGATKRLLRERPDLEGPLRRLVELDEDAEVWTFDAAPMDSGPFGEVVSRGIVERRDGGYRLADPDAVRAALDGKKRSEPDWTSVVPCVRGAIGIPPRRAGVGLVGVLLGLALVRVVFVYPDVFRNGDVVLAGNDPWFYRHWVDRLVAPDPPAMGIEGVGDLPGDLGTHDVLVVVVLWLATELFAGVAGSPGVVLAWYPPIAAVVTGVGTYFLGTRISGDRRVGLASALLLAITPVHAFRTALGFADHHAFDHLWLVLAAGALVVLADRSDDWPTEPRWPTGRVLVGIVGLGIAVSASVLAWRGGPLFVAPVAAIAFLWMLSAVVADESPLVEMAPVLAGLALAAAITLGTHLGLGWVEPFRGYAPLLLFAGATGVVALGEAIVRKGYGVREAAVVGGFGGITVAGVAWVSLPDVRRAVDQFLVYMAETSGSGIVETRSLFGGDLGSIVAPIFLFGFVFHLAVLYLGWASWRASRDHRPPLLVATVYGWFFVGLAGIQLRFAGELAPFTSVFGGLGLVHLAERIGIARRSPAFEGTDAASIDDFRVPSRRNVVIMVGLVVLVANVGLVQLPIKADQIAVDDGVYRTAVEIDDHADSRGRTYPENYVLSEWGRNRVFNYVVNGRSASYEYARSTYGPAMVNTNVSRWSSELLSRPVGYVVVREGSVHDPMPRSLYVRLYEHHGSRAGNVSGLGRFQLVSIVGYRKAFAVVPGATVVGEATPNATVNVSTTVTVDGATFEYVRTARTDETGEFEVQVAYPGTYRVDGGSQIHVPTWAVYGDATSTNRTAPGAIDSRRPVGTTGDRRISPSDLSVREQYDTP